MQRFPSVTQRLHLVFGGELVSATKNVLKDVNALHVVGLFPDYTTAVVGFTAFGPRTVATQPC